jgi:hypothetical protein
MASVSGNNIATNQATVITTVGGTLIVGPRPDRKRLTLIMAGAVDTFIGPQGVTAANGALLLGTKGSQLVLETTAAVYGINASTAVVSYIEEFA